MSQEMERDERVFVIGEDVGHIGGTFGVTRGLFQKFGKDRLMNTPISEMGIAGAAVGSAVCGRRPIAEIQIFDFVTFMMDMIVNQAAKLRYMLGGASNRPGGVPRSAGRRHPTGRAALAIAGGMVRACAGPGRRGAVDALRRQGPADSRRSATTIR